METKKMAFPPRIRTKLTFKMILCSKKEKKDRGVSVKTMF